MRPVPSKPTGGAGTAREEEIALLAARAAADKRATDVVILDLREITLITDFFVVCQGTSDVQIRAIVEGVREALKEHDRRPLSVEGMAQARWVLLDYGDLVVHVMAEAERGYYDLERLWGDARRIPFDDA
jgi:ribosome-associated protein